MSSSPSTPYEVNYNTHWQISTRNSMAYNNIENSILCQCTRLYPSMLSRDSIMEAIETSTQFINNSQEDAAPSVCPPKWLRENTKVTFSLLPAHAAGGEWRRARLYASDGETETLFRTKDGFAIADEKIDWVEVLNSLVGSGLVKGSVLPIQAALAKKVVAEGVRPAVQVQRRDAAGTI